MRPSDAGRLRGMYARTSPATRYRRFMAAMPKISERALGYLTTPAPDRVVFVAKHHGRIIGEARYHRTSTCEAELAVIVEDEWQRRGVGRALTQRLAERARRDGIAFFTGSMLADNVGARALMRSLFLTMHTRISEGELLFRIPLVEPALARCG